MARYKNSEKIEKYDKKKKQMYKISSAVFLTLIAGTAAAMTFLKRPEVSENEKRELAKFPSFSFESWFDGSFAEALDSWFTDTVPFRDKLTDAASGLENMKGIPAPRFYGNVQKVVEERPSVTETDPGFHVITKSPEETVPPQETTAPTDNEPGEVTSAETDVPAVTEETSAPTETEIPEETFDGNINEFLNNGILVDGVDMYGDKAGIMLYYGNAPEGLHYASVINSMAEAFGDDVNVYNMVVPTSVEFYLPRKYAGYTASEKEGIDNIYSSLSGNVTAIDAYSVLEAHKDEYIYFRTDHHWTQLGAYYAYTAFCEAAGTEASALSDFEKRTKTGFVGSLYSYTNDKTLKNAPEVFDYYVPTTEYSSDAYDGKSFRYLGKTTLFHEYADGVNMYGMFLGGDNMHIKITTNNNTGRKIALFKESYGNAFAPYLVNNFDEIYIIDIRYFAKNAVTYLKDNGITDVLFLDNIFAANTEKLVNDIDLLRKK